MLSGMGLPIGGTRDHGGKLIHQRIGGILVIHHGLREASVVQCWPEAVTVSYVRLLELH